MKRFVIMLGTLGLILASCAVESEDTNVNSESSTTATIADTTKSEDEKYYTANGKELNVKLSSYSDGVKILTADDIYLQGFDCGYISSIDKSYKLIVNTPEQLDSAFEIYGLDKKCDNSISTPFNEMVEKYPVADYTYVVEYEITSSGIYNMRLGALVLDEKYMNFVTTTDSTTPNRDEPQPDVMGGYCFMAAVPKGTLMNDCYESWTYPDRNDMYQDKDFCYSVIGCIYKNTELFDIYCDTQYIIRNDDELKEFVDMSKDLKNDSGNSAFTFNRTVDFDNAVLFCEFFKCVNIRAKDYRKAELSIDDEYVDLGVDGFDGDRTGFAYAVIPKKYIPESMSSYWEILDEEEDVERPTSEIEKYYNIDSDYIEEGYVAVFHGGVGERTSETYVYKEDDGLRYVNVVSTTISWGSPIWEHKKKSKGSGKTKEEIMEIADKHGADSFVTFYDDTNPHDINEFMEMDFSGMA